MVQGVVVAQNLTGPVLNPGSGLLVDGLLPDHAHVGAVHSDHIGGAVQGAHHGRHADNSADGQEGQRSHLGLAGDGRADPVVNPGALAAEHLAPGAKRVRQFGKPLLQALGPLSPGGGGAFALPTARQFSLWGMQDLVHAGDASLARFSEIPTEIVG